MSVETKTVYGEWFTGFHCSDCDARVRVHVSWICPRCGSRGEAFAPMRLKTVKTRKVRKLPGFINWWFWRNQVSLQLQGEARAARPQ